jgi:hypothetical protein
MTPFEPGGRLELSSAGGVMSVGSVIRGEAPLGTDRWRPPQRFLRHLLEMTVAMVFGMVVLGMAFRQLHIALFGTVKGFKIPVWLTPRLGGTRG